MARLNAGTWQTVKRKLHLSLPETIDIKNECGRDVEFEVDEVPDGSKPKITIRIVKLLRRKK